MILVDLGKKRMAHNFHGLGLPPDFESGKCNLQENVLINLEIGSWNLPMGNSFYFSYLLIIPFPVMIK